MGAGRALGKGLYELGFWLRAVGSFGRYYNDGSLLTRDYIPTTFDGEDTFLAALAGYQFSKGALKASCSQASRPRTSTFRHTIPTTRCKEAKSG